MSGDFSLNFLPIPVMVPPVPAPAITMSTLPVRGKGGREGGRKEGREGQGREGRERKREEGEGERGWRGRERERERERESMYITCVYVYAPYHHTAVVSPQQYHHNEPMGCQGYGTIYIDITHKWLPWQHQPGPICVS